MSSRRGGPVNPGTKMGSMAAEAPLLFLLTGRDGRPDFWSHGKWWDCGTHSGRRKGESRGWREVSEGTWGGTVSSWLCGLEQTALRIVVELRSESPCSPEKESPSRNEVLCDPNTGGTCFGPSLRLRCCLKASLPIKGRERGLR